MTVEVDYLVLETPPVDPLTGAVSGVYSENTFHAEEAISHIIEYIKHGPRNQKVLSSTMTQAQELETVLWYMKTAFDLTGTSGPAGEQLDFIGRLVGEGRQGRDDTAYLQAIRVRILVNSSDGTTEEILAILLAINPSITLSSFHESLPAGLYIEADSYGLLTRSQASRLINAAMPAAVQVTVTSDDATIGAVDADPLGGIVGAVDGDPLGFLISGG